jgi:hypothetical protein
MLARMECPVCRLINPPDTLLCDCGYDFKKGAGGKRTPFRKRHAGALLVAGLLASLLLLLRLCAQLFAPSYNVP